MNTDKFWINYDPKTYRQNTRCLSVNTILAGKYLVGPVLGQGGFGITYQGYDLNMETRIAIKEYFPVELVSRDTTTMHGDHVLSLSGEKSVTYQQGLRKYVAEAQNVSQFSDIPGIVSVKDFFYENDTAYIVMEYIEGESLKDYLKERGGRLSEEETLRIMKPVLEALVQVHKAGIIHRDISPDNIMLTFEEEAAGKTGSNEIQNADGSDAGNALDSGRKIKDVKLIDFGAARMTAKNDQKSLTIILKHGYAPEEQYRTHGEQGPWTDVYAICATMYRMLTGETPVPAMDRLFQDELKSFDELGVKISTNTAEAIRKGLAVKKDDRIRTMQELIGALYEGKTAKRTGGGRRGRSGAGKEANSRRFLAVGVGAAVLAVCIGIYSATGNRAGSGTEPGESVPPVSLAAPVQGTEKNAESSAVGVVSERAETEEEFGEILVTVDPQTSYASGADHVVILEEDGTVTSLGSNQYGQRNLSDWTRVAAVAAGTKFSAGLRENGTVVIAGELEGADDVERWNGITAIAAGGNYLYGLTREGTITTNGMPSKYTDNFLDWKNLKAIAASETSVAALGEDGTVRISYFGKMDLRLVPISGWQDVKHLVCAGWRVFGITEDGEVCCDVPYEGEIFQIPEEEHMESFHDIVQLYSCGGRVQTGVKSDGTVCIGGVRIYEEGQEMERMTSEWTDMRGIIGTQQYIPNLAGIRRDGALVKETGNGGNSSLQEMCDLEWIHAFQGDTEGENVLAITKDGKLMTYGTATSIRRLDSSNQPENPAEILPIWNSSEGTLEESTVWLSRSGELFLAKFDESEYEQEDSGIKQIASGFPNETVCYCAGLSAEGKVRLYPLSEEKIPESLCEAESWNQIRQIAIFTSRDQYGSSILGLREDGTVEAVSENGNLKELTEDWNEISGIYAGPYAVGAIKEDGTAIFLEDSAEYNYGQYNTFGWTDLVQLALGTYHTVGLRADGTVCATGDNHVGQCDVEDWTDMIAIAASENCTYGIRSDGTLWIAGDAGW